MVIQSRLLDLHHTPIHCKAFLIVMVIESRLLDLHHTLIHCKAFIIVMLILEYIPIEAINYIAEPMLRLMSVVHIELVITVTEQIRLVAAAVSALSN